MKKILLVAALSLAGWTFQAQADSGPGRNGSGDHYYDWDDDGHKSSGHYYDDSKQPTYQKPKSQMHKHYVKKQAGKQAKHGKHAKGKAYGHQKGKGHGKHGKGHGHGHGHHQHGPNHQ